MSDNAAPVIMGILNVTPDSFSDGGRYTDADAAIEHALRMRDDGADIVDVGGESTRPGAGRVDAATEIARTAEIVGALVAEGLTVSIDTTRAAVARAAVERGAGIVNDVSGGLADAAMAPLVAESGCRFVLMHWRGHSADMYAPAGYGDVVAEVAAELSQRVDSAVAAGVAGERIILDPGIGFAKLPEHNWSLLKHLDALVGLGHPVLYGASLKSHLGRLLAGPDGEARAVEERADATLATSVLAFASGAWGVRVHDVRGTADARAVWEATRHARLGVREARGCRTVALVADHTDQITLSGLRVHGFHGVYDRERADGQEFIVDVTLRLDTRKAAASDNIHDTVHYGTLADALVAAVAGSPVRLLETLADRLAAECLADPRVASCAVTVHKPQAPIPHSFTDVSVTIERSRE